ncbi:MAG TPA: class D sortase [Bryobacteraceae bacterium]|nr:class D sortase [Bryobacteraceae bacterium]
MRWLLFLCGVAGIGYYGYSLANEHVYQAYENWAFDQEIAGRTVTFTDWLRERTPLGGYMAPAKSSSASNAEPAKPKEALPGRLLLPEGAMVGRVLIPRLHLSAIVLQGVEMKTLERGAGHVPSTAMPGQTGNFAIAAHRDTLFRPLRFIEKNDDVTFESTTGSYTYQVVSTQIVLPSDVGVLRAPPGGGKWLTLITCYPFYYVGSAPKRFIVQAKLVSTDPDSKLTARAGTDTSPPEVTHAREQPKPAKHSSLHEPRQVRGSSAFARHRRRGFHRATGKQERTETAETVSSAKPKKKRGFWHRLASRF